MKPPKRPGFPGLVWRADLRAIHALLAMGVIALLILAMTGCQGVGGALLANVGGGLIDAASYSGAYKAHYSKSGWAVISAETSPKDGRTPFLLVDGHPQDEAGFAYSLFHRIYVSPGRHRLLCKVVFPGTGARRETYSIMEIDVAAQHSYRLGTAQQGNSYLLQLWDQTDGVGQRTLQNEAIDPPEAADFLRAVRLFDAAPDSAIILGDSPKRFNAWEGKVVYFGAVIQSNEPRYPWEMLQMRFFPEGNRRIVVHLEGTGFFPGLGSRTMPPMEVKLTARHVYRITARWQDRQNLVQIWDETDGEIVRTLVKEYHFTSWGN